MKPCPMCAEPIEDAARKCKHCGEYLDESARAYLAYAANAKLMAQVLLAVGLILAVGVHLRRTA